MIYYPFLVSPAFVEIRKDKPNSFSLLSAVSPSEAKRVYNSPDGLLPIVVAFQKGSTVYHTDIAPRSEVRQFFPGVKKFATVEGSPDLSDYFTDLIEEE